MKQLSIDITEDKRTAKDGSALATSTEPRHARLWLWTDGVASARFVGELFFDAGELAQLLQAKPVIEFAAQTADLQIIWGGLVPEIAPHPRMGKAMAALKTVAKWFT